MVSTMVSKWCDMVCVHSIIITLRFALFAFIYLGIESCLLGAGSRPCLHAQVGGPSSNPCLPRASRLLARRSCSCRRPRKSPGNEAAKLTAGAPRSELTDSARLVSTWLTGPFFFFAAPKSPCPAPWKRMHRVHIASKRKANNNKHQNNTGHQKRPDRDKTWLV